MRSFKQDQFESATDLDMIGVIKTFFYRLLLYNFLTVLNLYGRLRRCRLPQFIILGLNITNQYLFERLFSLLRNRGALM